tara:strand:- start:272 stop:523 length:252 start_codon:yes stop_codon:yes gene_type:complete
MDDSKRNSLVLQIATVLENDNISPDEQDPEIMKKYYNFASKELKIEISEATEIVNESFLYLKMKQTSDIDPVKEGDRFAAGFS